MCVASNGSQEAKASQPERAFLVAKPTRPGFGYAKEIQKLNRLKSCINFGC